MSCGRYENVEIEAKGHLWGEWVIDSEPTCHLSGYKWRECKNCSGYDDEIIEPLAHNYKWTTVSTVMCYIYKEYKCQNCGESIDFKTEVNHNWVEVPGKEATDTEDGYSDSIVCSKCGAYKKDKVVIPKNQSTSTSPSTTSSYSNEWNNGKWYNADGSQTYSGTLTWKCNSTGWWVEDSDGWYPVSCWQKIDGSWYYFTSSGYMASNEYYNGYWFNGNGSWDESYYLTWKSNSIGWWVEDKSGWWPSSQWLKIDGSWYYFNLSGYMVTSQYIDGYWIGANGVCQ